MRSSLRKFIAIAAGVAIFGASTLSPGVTRATIVTPYAMTGSQPVVTGVTHEWGSSQAEWYPDPENETDPPPPPELTTQQINILRVERDAPDFQFETSLPWDEVNNRQTTLGQALSESRPGHRVRWPFESRAD